MEEGLAEKPQNAAASTSPPSLASQQNATTNTADHSSDSSQKADPKEFIAKFLPGDPDNPQNFSMAKKSFMLFQMSLLAFVGSLGSSIITPAQSRIAAYTNSSTEVTVLTLALFVLGFAFGPLLWAPVSEVYGRKVSMLPAVFILGLFSIGTATSTTAAGIYITRFFGGLFGSAPISNVSAALGDFYSPLERGIAMTFLAMCVVGGPTIAPVVGAAITVNPNMGWRCKLNFHNSQSVMSLSNSLLGTEYIEAILSFASVALSFFFLPETYGPVLLKRKAAALRKSTGDDRWWHPQEKEKINPSNIVTKYISRPLR